MKLEQIEEHKKNKEKDPNYPKLPKFILEKKEKELSNNLQQIALSAFLKRVKNYNKNKYYQELNKL